MRLSLPARSSLNGYLAVSASKNGSHGSLQIWPSLYSGLWIILDVGHCQVLRTEIVVWTVAVYDEYIVGAKGDQFTIYICGF